MLFKTSDIRKVEKLQIYVNDIVSIATAKGPMQIVKCQSELSTGQTIWLSFVYNADKHSAIKSGNTYLVQAKYSTKESLDQKTGKVYLNHYLSAVKVIG